MPGPRARLLLSVAVWLLVAGPRPCRADVVHLKNGGTIAADSIDYREHDLVIHQGRSQIVVPRADVASIEPSRPAVAPAGPGAAGAAAPAPGAHPGGGSPSGDDAEADARRLDDLRRRLLEPGLAQAENRRQVVALLDRMGERSLRARHADEARRRFEEALTWDASDLRGKRGLAAAHLALDQVPLARSVAERALLEHDGDPDLLVLLGEAAVRESKADEAIADWTRALAVRPDPVLTARLETLKRQHAVDGSYRTVEGARFTVSYDGGRTLPDLEHAIVDSLDGDFTDLATRFDYLPPRPIGVVIYPEQDFYAATRADRDVAGLFDGTIRVPCGGLKRLDPEVRAVLLHELTHAFVAGKSGGTAPRWLHEGLAQYVEGLRTDASTARALARSAASGELPVASFSYASALSFVEFLVDRFAFHSLNQALERLGAGDDADASLRAATGFGLEELQRQWADALAARLQ
jgi:tetratricopeptide (TPR) repeat protein